MEEKQMNVKFSTAVLCIIIVLLIAGIAYFAIENNRLETERKKSESDIKQLQTQVGELQKTIDEVRNVTATAATNTEVSNTTTNTNKTTQDNKYTEITKELGEEEKLFVTDVEKNNGEYTLKGVIYKPYTISKREYDEIISKGKMEYVDNYNPEKTINYTVKKDKENGNKYALFHPKHRGFC